MWIPGMSRESDDLNSNKNSDVSYRTGEPPNITHWILWVLNSGSSIEKMMLNKYYSHWSMGDQATQWVFPRRMFLCFLLNSTRTWFVCKFPVPPLIISMLAFLFQVSKLPQPMLMRVVISLFDVSYQWSYLLLFDDRVVSNSFIIFSW